MKKTLAGALGVLALLSVQALTGAPATAAVPGPIAINFTGEPSGAQANGYSPTGGVTFSDTIGADLEVEDFGGQSHGQGLAVNPDDSSALTIALPNPALSISLAFGNDHPGVVDATDLASLTLFRGATQVGKVLKNVNANDLMDQRIKFSRGRLFNRAVFVYVDAAESPKNLIEIVDDIKVGPICTVVGTAGNDNLNGTSGHDVICASGGKDTIRAGGGHDLIFAGDGRDRVFGGRGGDRLIGGEGRDYCHGGAGTDSAKSCEVKERIP
jgi:hypothetical protein